MHTSTVYNDEALADQEAEDMLQNSDDNSLGLPRDISH